MKIFNKSYLTDLKESLARKAKRSPSETAQTSLMGVAGIADIFFFSPQAEFDARLGVLEISNAHIDSVDLSGITISKVDFKHCDFINVNLDDSIILDSEFDSCEFRSGTTLRDTAFSQCILHETTFSAVDMDGFRFSSSLGFTTPIKRTTLRESSGALAFESLRLSEFTIEGGQHEGSVFRDVVAITEGRFAIAFWAARANLANSLFESVGGSSIRLDESDVSNSTFKDCFDVQLQRDCVVEGVVSDQCLSRGVAAQFIGTHILLDGPAPK